MENDIQLTQLDNGNLCIVVPMSIKRMRARKAIILPEGQPTKDGEFSEAVQLPLASDIATAVARAFANVPIIGSSGIRQVRRYHRAGQWHCHRP